MSHGKMQYMVESGVSGAILWVGEASSEDEAIDAMARAHGYESHAEVESHGFGDRSDLVVTVGPFSARKALAYAEALAEGCDSVLWKYADPTEGARQVTLSEAADIALDDPSLLTTENLGQMDAETQQIQAELERIGVADTGHGGCVALSSGRAGIIRIVDESVDLAYALDPLAPTLQKLPSNLVSAFSDDEGPDGETAERKAYEHFWQTIMTAQVEE